MTQNPNLAALSAAGVSVWLDDLSRDRLQSGNLQELIDTKSVVGVTPNPSLFHKAFADSHVYPHPQVDSRVRARGLRRSGAAMGGLRRNRRPGVHRGRPEAGTRDRQDDPA